MTFLLSDRDAYSKCFNSIDVGTSDAAEALRNGWLRPMANIRRHVSTNELIATVRKIGQRVEDWDNNRSAAANHESVSRAISIADRMVEQAEDCGCSWRDPFVSLDESGNIVFEWWNENKKVTLYVLPEASEFIKSWGTDIETEMMADELHGQEFQDIWRWLNSD